jgi:hypothetical protein
MLELVEVHGIAQQSMQSGTPHESTVPVPGDASHVWFPVNPTHAGSAFTSRLPLGSSASKDKLHVERDRLVSQQ